jgi:hypothetical protein
MIACQVSEDENIEKYYKLTVRTQEEKNKGPVVEDAYRDAQWKNDLSYSEDDTLKIDIGSWR